MPNNLLILAYIQCMKDRTIEAIKFCNEQNKINGRNVSSHNHEAYLKDIENLEKFIKGGN